MTGQRGSGKILELKGEWDLQVDAMNGSRIRERSG